MGIRDGYETIQDKTRQDKTGQDKTRQDKTRQDKTIQDLSHIHISEPTRLSRNTYAVFGLKKKISKTHIQAHETDRNIVCSKLHENKKTMSTTIRNAHKITEHNTH